MHRLDALAVTDVTKRFNKINGFVEGLMIYVSQRNQDDISDHVSTHKCISTAEYIYTLCSNNEWIISTLKHTTMVMAKHRNISPST